MKVLHLFTVNKQRLAVLSFFILFTCSTIFGQLKITSGASITTTGNAQVYIAGLDLDNEGMLDASGATFHFTGTTNNIITGNGSAITFNNLTINKTAGGQLALNNPVNVDGNLNFVSGNIELNSQVINLGNTGFFTGESETSHATGITGGSINANAVLNAPAAVNIGNLGAVITSSANMGAVTISRKHLSANIPAAGGKSIYRSYDFTVANNSSLNATLTLNYFNSELNGINENNLTQFQTPDNITYTNMGYFTRDVTTNFVTQMGYSNIARFTLANPAGPLPVTLTSFTAQCNSNWIHLNWKTASEQTADRFDIQRSANGTVWVKIAVVKAAGNSGIITSYQYDDKTLLAPTAFYRLAQYDLDGRVVYSSIVKAGCDLSAAFTVMPNPVTNIAKVVIGTAKNNTGTLILFNATGQQVMQQPVKLTSGINQFSLNMRSLAKGNYNLVFVQSDASNQTIKIIKQ